MWRLDLGKHSEPMVQPGGFISPLRVNMPRRTLRVKSITYKQFKREAWSHSNKRENLGGRASSLSLSHSYSMCPITLFLPALLPNLLSFFLLSCWRPVHGISLFCLVVPAGMVSHGVPRATKQLRLSFPSCKKRPISWLPDKHDDWVSDISLHVQKIPSFFIILSLNHSRKYFLNVLIPWNLMIKGDLNLK